MKPTIDPAELQAEADKIMKRCNEFIFEASKQTGHELNFTELKFRFICYELAQLRILLEQRNKHTL